MLPVFLPPFLLSEPDGSALSRVFRGKTVILTALFLATVDSVKLASIQYKARQQAVWQFFSDLPEILQQLISD